MDINNQSRKEQIRKKHLEWLEQELNKIDFGKEYDQEQLIFAMGNLVLELCGHKRNYEIKEF